MARSFFFFPLLSRGLATTLLILLVLPVLGGVEVCGAGTKGGVLWVGKAGAVGAEKPPAGSEKLGSPVWFVAGSI